MKFLRSFFQKATASLIHKLGNAASVSGNGIVGSGDRSAYNDIVGAYLLSLGGGHNSLLVTDVTVCEANAGGYGNDK